MNDFMLEMALRHYDLTENQITQIKAAIPKFAYVAQLFKHNATVLGELIGIVELLATQIAKKESQ